MTTPKEGTRRLATALKGVTHGDFPLDVKQEITAASVLLGSHFGVPISVQQFLDRYNLSDKAREAIVKQLPSANLADDVFILEKDEFQSIVSFTSIDLHTGGSMTAPSDKFESIFRREPINKGRNEYRFTTEGRVVDEKLLKGKRPL